MIFAGLLLTILSKGIVIIISKIQQARRAWKDRAYSGLTSGFLIMFCELRLAHAKPGEKLLDVCQKLSELYIPETLRAIYY